MDYALGRPSTSRQHRRPEYIKFAEFVASMLERAEVSMPTLLVTLVYIQRAKHHLHIGLEQWALERVFLGALIVASKVCLFSLTAYLPYLIIPAVPQRFNTKERSLVHVHWHFRQARHWSYRTGISRCP